MKSLLNPKALDSLEEQVQEWEPRLAGPISSHVGSSSSLGVRQGTASKGILLPELLLDLLVAKRRER